MARLPAGTGAADPTVVGCAVDNPDHELFSVQRSGLWLAVPVAVNVELVVVGIATRLDSLVLHTLPPGPFPLQGFTLRVEEYNGPDEVEALSVLKVGKFLRSGNVREFST